MDKCQQFIDKVIELRFLKIKGQVNKFNRLMLKKQGNITWSSAVPLVNPQAGTTSPQVASTSIPQAGGLWEDSASQAASTSSPKTVSFQAVSSCQAGSSWEDSTSQAASTSAPKQLMLRQLALTLPRQSADPQVVSTPVIQPVNSWKDSTAQAASASGTIRSSKQLVLRQSALPRQLVPGKIVLLRWPALLPHKQLVLRQ